MLRRLSAFFLGLVLILAGWTPAHARMLTGPDATITVYKGTATNLGYITVNNNGLQAKVPSAGAGATYAWTVSGGNITAGQGTSVITFTDTAAVGATVTVSVMVTDASMASNNGIANLTVVQSPSLATITTASNITEGGASHAIAETTIPGATYAWQPTSGVTYASTTSGSTTYTTTATNGSGNTSATTISLSCKVTNQDGPSATASKSVNVWALPAAPTVTTVANDGVTPVSKVAAGSTGNKANAPAIPVNTSYKWTVTNGSITAGQGTAQITYTAGSTAGSSNLVVTCTASNPAGGTTPGSAYQSIVAAPSGTITAYNAASANLAYVTVNNSNIKAKVLDLGAGATYAWTITGGTITAGQGTSIITFKDTAAVGGTITLGVTATNSLGASANGSTNLTVVQSPSYAAVNTALNITQGSTSHAISDTVIPGATYAWQPVTGVAYGSSTASSTTYTTTVTNSTNNTSAATISLACKITNQDGPSATASKTVSIWALPAVPSITTVKSDGVTQEIVAVTASTTGHIAYAPPIPANTTYKWTVTNGVITSGQGTAQITYTTGSTVGSNNLVIKCTAANPALGTRTGSVSLSIVPVPDATITVSKGATSGLSGATLNGTGYQASVPDLGTGGNYSWSVSGGSITSGGAGSSITFSATGGLGSTLTLHVTATNWAGDSASGSKDLTIVAAPAITSFNATPHSVTSGSTGTLTAAFTGGTGSVDQGVGAVTSGVGASTPTLSSTTLFTLSVSNLGGDTATATAAITVAQAGGTGSMAKARYYATQTLLPNGKVLVAGGYNSTDGYLKTLELYDPQTGTFSTSAASLTTARFLHTATLLPNGKVLIVGGQTTGNSALASAELYDWTTDSVSSTGGLTTGRAYHSATLMPNGKVLVAAGSGSGGVLASVEVYNPGTGTFSQPVGSALKAARTEHVAVLLSTGKVLLIGGISTSPLSSAELYDPATNTSAFTGSLGTPRYLHSGVAMANGKVLVTGGYNSGYLNTAEIYDPAAGTFSASANTMTINRIYHPSLLLRNGLILIAGGDGTGTYVASCELYDPATDTFTAATSLPAARCFNGATLLPDGRVLLAGGIGGASSTYLATADLWDPSEPHPGVWNQTIGTLLNKRELHTSTLLPNGKVLIVGGQGPSFQIQGQCELFDPATGVYTASVTLGTARLYHSATVLPNGKVLIAGGSDSSNTIISSAELYDPATDTIAPTGSMTEPRRNHTATLLPNGKVLITGSLGSSDKTAELYDPSTGTFSLTGSMTTPRWLNEATLLPNGKVLISGGRSSGSDVATTELYDPSTGTFTASGSMGTVREAHLSALLPNGKVLLAGGYANYPNTPTLAELFDPQTGTCTPTGSLANGRYGFGWSATANGKVLMVGGYTGSAFLNSAEVYDPTAGTFSSTGTILTPYEDYMATTLLPNGKILMNGGYDIDYSNESQVYQ